MTDISCIFMELTCDVYGIVLALLGRPDRGIAAHLGGGARPVHQHFHAWWRRHSDLLQNEAIKKQSPTKSKNREHHPTRTTNNSLTFTFNKGLGSRTRARLFNRRTTTTQHTNRVELHFRMSATSEQARKLG